MGARHSHALERKCKWDTTVLASSREVTESHKVFFSIGTCSAGSEIKGANIGSYSQTSGMLMR